MAISFGIGKSRPIHIIIKDHVIRYVEFKQTNPPIVQHFAERYLPTGLVKDGKIIDQETLAIILEECLDDWKIKKRKVTFHVPDSLVVIRKIDIPADVRDDEIHGYLYMELGSTIHLPFEEPIFDFTLLDTPDGKKEIILFVTPEKTVDDLTWLLETAKLDPVAADISVLSLYRLYDQLIDSRRTGQLMLVQIDVQAVNVCVFEAQYPVFMRHIPIPVDMEKWDYSSRANGNEMIHYTGNVEELQLLLTDAYREVSRVIDFYRYTLNQGNKQVSNLYITGDHPWIGLIIREISKEITVPILTIPEEKIATTTSDVPLPIAFHCLVGLGLKEV